MTHCDLSVFTESLLLEHVVMLADRMNNFLNSGKFTTLLKRNIFVY